VRAVVESTLLASLAGSGISRGTVRSPVPSTRTGATANPPLDRVAERRHAVALARHYREAEGMSIAQIAERLGRAPATIKGYFYDPTQAIREPTPRVNAHLSATCAANGACRGARSTRASAGQNARRRGMAGQPPGPAGAR
jgi:hypothetical protein